jgi:predicted N-acyltransferase
MYSADFAIRLVASQQDIPAALWQRCFPPPLEAQWWYETLERSELEDQFEFFYAVLSQGGEAVGIAPMFVHTLRLNFLVPSQLGPVFKVLGALFPKLDSPRILFVGCPCSEEGSVGLLPGIDRRQAFEALQWLLDSEAVRRGASAVAWKDFPPESEADLVTVAAGHGLFRVVSFPSTVIDPLPSTHEAYLAGLKTTRRRNIRRKLRDSHAALKADVEVVQNPDGKTLDAIYALFDQTRSRADLSLEDLGRPFFVEIAKQPASHFLLLREQGTAQLVAFMLAFAVGDVVIAKYIGLDYTRPNKNEFLYFRLLDEALRWAMARGARAFHNSQTGYSGKLETGHRLVPLTVYARHRNKLINWIGRTVARRISWATLDDDLAEYLQAHPEASRDGSGEAR